MEKNEFFKWLSRRNFGRTVVLLLAFVVIGCSSHPCREPRAPELDRTKSVKPNESDAPSTEGPSAGASIPVKAPDSAKSGKSATDLVRVYKPDGSRQCEKKPGIPLDTMERELAGIVVVGREKRKDGLMHIQVCGSPSGMINIFEISTTFLKQAEQRGFKRLED